MWRFCHVLRCFRIDNCLRFPSDDGRSRTSHLRYNPKSIHEQKFQTFYSHPPRHPGPFCPRPLFQASTKATTINTYSLPDPETPSSLVLYKQVQQHNHSSKPRGPPSPRSCRSLRLTEQPLPVHAHLSGANKNGGLWENVSTYRARMLPHLASVDAIV